MDGRANPLIDRNVVRFVLFGVAAVATSPTTAECSVVWCVLFVVVVLAVVVVQL